MQELSEKNSNSYKQMKHQHWQIYGFDEMKENGQLTNAVVIEVLDQPIESLALEQAKKMVQRPRYQLFKVWECNQCSTIEEQKEYMKEAKKFMKRALE